MGSWNSAALGRLYSVPSKNGLMAPSRVRGSGTPLINMREIFASDRITDGPMELAPIPGNDPEAWMVRADDLLFARQSLKLEGAGKCVLVQPAERQRTFESHIIRVRLNPEAAHAPFYFYYFRSAAGRDNMMTIVEQVAAAGIRASDLQLLEVPVPPIQEQRAIAATLGALDDKIESNHRQIATADALADELWVGIARASQTCYSIDDLAAAGTLLLSDGYRTRVDQLGEPGVPILRVADVAADHFAVRPGADQILDTYRPKYQEKISMAGDVVVTTKGTVGRTALVGPEDVAAVYSPQICFIRSLDREALPPTALHRWVRSETFRSQARQVQNQTDMAAYISLTDFRRFRLPLVDPGAAELTEIEELDLLIAARRQETASLETTRDSLLPELLSGCIRVPEAAEATDGLA